MKKTYIVRLSDDERQTLLAVVKKLKGTSTKVRRANILLKADAMARIGKTKILPMPFSVRGSASKMCEKNSSQRVLTSP